MSGIGKVLFLVQWGGDTGEQNHGNNCAIDECRESIPNGWVRSNALDSFAATPRSDHALAESADRVCWCKEEESVVVFRVLPEVLSLGDLAYFGRSHDLSG